ncbi:aminotransferase class V-fold PLP-dependent enzyme [Aliifodinibius salicampi]|uniref:Aminotransferase class V-fold PLP-dependent enzyme n=1 Tax=Fodinibius salicampi TaxID=1920655 RepID=A0ABT3PZE5_9BACT|nr:aminotransferase class V-fold PLP-dependent enzyme [Fodinibius salicampi]MCW9713217.1 aminotransferase class V-fold PLP-dependent enzyme [Fodinibius salicampi]
MERKEFLKQTGLILGSLPTLGSASLTAASKSEISTTYDPMSWSEIRDQFELRRSHIHMSTFLLSSHPKPVAEAIERHRNALDEDPAHYWEEHFMTAEPQQQAAAGEYLNANPDHIALTDSTTMGLGLVYGMLKLRPGQEIVTTTHGHFSTDLSLKHRAERTKAKIRKISLYDNPAEASVDEIVSRAKSAITEQTRVIAVTWVHSSTGVKLPIKEIAQVLQEMNRSREMADRILLCVDGVHGFGIENMRVDDLECDFFIAGTHKWLFGPRGTGIIWGRDEAWEALDPIIPNFGPSAGVWIGALPVDTPLITPGNFFTPGGFHSFEHRWALAEAFRFHLDIGKERVQERIHTLNTMTKEALAGMPHVQLHTPMSTELSSGLVCFDVDGYSPEQVVEEFHRHKITASTTPYRDSHARLAPSLINNEEEVERTVEVIAKM